MSYTPFKGIVSEDNNTTTPLAGGASYSGNSGNGEQNNYAYAAVDCTSDVSGTLYFEFSVDGTNWSTYPNDGYKLTAGGRVFRSAYKGSRLFRPRFVNDSAAQSYFRLYTYYDHSAILDAALNQSLALDGPGLSTRPTIAQDEITRNLRGGVTQLNKFAYRDAVDTADGEALVISDSTTNTPTILTTASTFTITYNNATDGASTTGALSLLFTYLDGNEDQQTATHTLGSTGSDVTSFSGLGINRVVVLSSGSVTYNTNDITITATTGGSVQAFIQAEASVTEQLWIHIPRNTKPVQKYLFLNALRISGGASPRVRFKIYAYSRITSTRYRIFNYLIDTAVEDSKEFVDPSNFPYSARDVIYVTAETDTNNTEVSAKLSLNIYDVIA